MGTLRETKFEVKLNVQESQRTQKQNKTKIYNKNMPQGDLMQDSHVFGNEILPGNFDF